MMGKPRLGFVKPAPERQEQGHTLFIQVRHRVKGRNGRSYIPIAVETRAYFLGLLLGGIAPPNFPYRFLVTAARPGLVPGTQQTMSISSLRSCRSSFIATNSLLRGIVHVYSLLDSQSIISDIV